MAIIISKEGSGTRRIEPIGIPQETMLQEFVQDHPEVLPMNEIREDVRLLVIAREFSTRSGSIDVLAVDQDGEIYIIETKLYKNPDKRQVLAQAIDYGASLWAGFSSGEEFIADLRAALNMIREVTLEDAFKDSFGSDSQQTSEILQLAVRNLQVGIFNFIILMDKMDDRMKDLIAYVNENSRFSIYGVELEFYQFDEYEIVIPRMFGAEVRKEVKGSSPRRTWDEKSYFEDARSRLDLEHVDALYRLYEFAQSTADRITWGTGVTMGSFNPRYEHITQPSIISVYSDGRLCVSFGALQKTEIGQDVAALLADGIKDELGFKLPGNYESSYPHFGPEEWCNKVDGLIELLSEVVASHT